MSAERLRQIWSGFEQTTTRNLTGKGVDGVIVPNRADYAAHDQDFLPENFEGPAERAFATLRADLKAKEKIFRRKKRKYSDDVDLPDQETSAAFKSDEVFRGMYATAVRVERSDIDYQSFLSSDAGKATLKKHKKKRFGIF